MRPECVQAVSAVLRRSLSQKEANGIEKRIRDQMKLLAGKDPTAWAALSKSDRLLLAAKKAADGIIGDAKVKQGRVAATILQRAKDVEWLDTQPGLKLDNIPRAIETVGDGLDNIESISTHHKAIANEYLREIITEIEKYGPKMLDLLRNDKALEPVFLELRATDTKNPGAKAFAGKLKSIFDRALERRNAAGGNTGKLDDYGTPQSYESSRVFKIGKQKFIDLQKDTLDLPRYVDEEGKPLDMDKFLSEAFDSIVYGKKQEASGMGGHSMVANRGSSHRQLHYKDGASYLRVHYALSGRSLMGTLLSHIDGMARDIAVLETRGPNAQLGLEMMLQDGIAEAKALGVDPNHVDKQVKLVRDMYNVAAGGGVEIVNPSFVQFMNTMKTIPRFLLGGAGLTSFLSDPSTMLVTARALNMSPIRSIIEELKLLPSETRMREARLLGLGVDSFIYAMRYDTSNGLLDTALSKGAGLTIKVGGLTRVTGAAKQGFGVMFQTAMAQKVKRYAHLSDLDPVKEKRLLGRGITEEDWQVWKKAKLNDGMLTGDAILAVGGSRHAADSYMGFLLDETDFAVNEIGVKERAAINVPRGTWYGEGASAFLQFKTFTISMTMKQAARAWSEPGVKGTIRYLAPLMVIGTVGGALKIQIQELLNLRDPLDMTEWSFLLKAISRGSGLGYLTDFMDNILAGTPLGASQRGGNIISETLGAAGAVFEEFGSLVKAGASAAIDTSDKDYHVGGKALKFGQRLIPMRTVPGIGAVIDHLFLQELQESLSPGYLHNVEKRGREVFKQEFYAKPGKLPHRSPNLMRAFGEE